MSRSFRLTRALVVLDGAVLYNGEAPAGKALPPEMSFALKPPPGEHALQVLLELRGYGESVFSKACGYTFDVKSVHSFTLKEGQGIHLEAIAWEKGDKETPMHLRPAVRYVERIANDSSRAGAPPAEAGR